jgi:hypothetical protein
MEETKLEIAKKIIKENYEDADCGIYDTRNLVYDRMTTIYDKDGLTIDICYAWSYFEVFGLDEEDFIELYHYYHELENNE